MHAIFAKSNGDGIVHEFDFTIFRPDAVLEWVK